MSVRDAWVVAGGLAHAFAVAAALTFAYPAGHLALAPRLTWIGCLAVGSCWASNTISHIHLHTPIFARAAANQAFSWLLTVTLGIPQSGWKRRHLRHHGLDEAAKAVSTAAEMAEIALLLGAWFVAAIAFPVAFFGVIAPAWLLGLGLCALQGHYEHVGANAAGVDYYGRLYNRLWFSDGHHSRHHLAPGAHWTTLTGPSPGHGAVAGGRASRWPPLLRWNEAWRRPVRNCAPIARALDLLERVALRSGLLRTLLLRTHAPALLAAVSAIGGRPRRRVCIVGGGLFPRTAILLGRILPDAELTIVDANADHLRAARCALSGFAGGEGDEGRAGEEGGPAGCVRHGRGRTTFVLGRCADVPCDEAGRPRFDLVVVPLAFRGDREPFYRTTSACAVLVHDWIWRRRGDMGYVVSPLLLKRINLVRGRVDRRFQSNLDTLTSEPSAAAEARCQPPCRMTAPTTPILPPSGARAPSPTMSWRDFGAATARRS